MKGLFIWFSGIFGGGCPLLPEISTHSFKSLLFNQYSLVAPWQ